MTTLRTLPEALAAAATSDEGYTFIDGSVETTRTYAELQRSAWSTARALRDVGVRRGDLVALVLGNAEDFLTALVGTAITGAVPASLYPPATAGQLARYLELTARILRASAARVIVTTPDLAPAFEGLRGQCPDLDLVLERGQLDAPPLEPDAWPALDDIAFVQFTSGSTSTPKGVTLSHRNLASNITAFCGPSGMRVDRHDIGVSWLPLNHDMGLVGMALGSIYSSVSTVLMTPQAFVKRPAEWLKAISRFGGTISFAPNFAYDLAVRRVKDRDLQSLDLSRWRVAGCGAEPIHAPTLAAFADRFGPVGFRATSFLASYGLAEHVLAATLSPLNAPPRVEHVASVELTESRQARPVVGDELGVPLVGCGVAFPGHSIRVIDEAGRELPEREVGEITLAGPSVMLGYYREAGLTAETIRDGWLRTGDLGYKADGHLFVCGRLKDVIIVNGRKYHPQDLEWAVHDLAGIRRGRVVAFGTTDGATADRVVMVVEPSGTATDDVLRDEIRRRIGDVFGLYVDEIAMVPGGSIGRTTSGKVQRALTKARYERGSLVGDAPSQAESYA
jgi:acyl-CoA synthetase (AMP-forming)/AMP-acid ligase II